MKLKTPDQKPKHRGEGTQQGNKLVFGHGRLGTE